MKRTKIVNRVFAVTTTALLSVVWQAGLGQSCLTGRYGHYNNWPSSQDWDELLVLLTGKYGNNGWGWSQPDSYAYNAVGDYPFGNLKYSASPWGTSGSSGGWSGSSSSGASSGGLKSTSSYKRGRLNGEKLREALNNYFKSKPSSSYYDGGSTNGGGGGWKGESFVDSPGGGPSYHEGPKPGPSYHDSPGPGSSYNDSPGPGPSYHDSPGPGPPYADNIGPGPPYPPTGNEGGPPSSYGSPSAELGSWPGGGNGGNSYNRGRSPPGGGDHASWPLPQEGSPPSGPPSHFNAHPISQNNNPYNSNEHGSGGSGGQFQSDFDTFGRYKRRRQGRRRSHNPQAQPSAPPQQYHKELQTQQIQPQIAPPPPPPQRKQRRRHPPPPPPNVRHAGLPTRPAATGKGKGLFKFPPYPGTGGSGGGGNRGVRISRKQRRLGMPSMSLRQRLLNTSFGGYKVDLSKLRFG